MHGEWEIHLEDHGKAPATRIQHIIRQTRADHEDFKMSSCSALPMTHESA
jgi:hypothetical protein